MVILNLPMNQYTWEFSNQDTSLKWMLMTNTCKYSSPVAISSSQLKGCSWDDDSPTKGFIKYSKS